MITHGFNFLSFFLHYILPHFFVLFRKSLKNFKKILDL
nr:MAG TPA: Cas system-associated protein [Caudoviricetes sp.]